MDDYRDFAVFLHLKTANAGIDVTLGLPGTLRVGAGGVAFAVSSETLGRRFEKQLGPVSVPKSDVHFLVREWPRHHGFHVSTKSGAMRQLVFAVVGKKKRMEIEGAFEDAGCRVVG